jgi:hypothetical protein
MNRIRNLTHILNEVTAFNGIDELKPPADAQHRKSMASGVPVYQGLKAVSLDLKLSRHIFIRKMAAVKRWMDIHATREDERITGVDLVEIIPDE